MPTCLNRLVRRLMALLLLAALSPLAQALSLGISVNPNPVRPGEGLVVSLTVTNDGTTPAAALTLTLEMPAAGVNSVSPTLASGSATCPGNCDPGELVQWNLGTLAPGRGVRLTLPLTVSGSAAGGSAITFPAKLLQGGVPARAITHSVAVDADNALSLAVDADADGVAPGGLLRYNVTYGNRSGVGVVGTSLTLPLPDGVTFVSATESGALSGNTVVWDLNTLRGAQSGRQQVVVSVGSGLASGALLEVNAAQVAGTSEATGAESARATLVTRVQASPVLRLAVASNADPARPGEGVRTALTVSNPTAATVFSAALRVRMPTEGFNTVSPGLHSGGATCAGNCDPYEFVDWNLGDLTPGAARTLLMVNTVSGSTSSGRLIGIDAELRAEGVPMVLAKHTIAVDADNALALDLVGDRDSAAPGDTLTYTLTYGNRSAASVTASKLALPLPAGLTFVSASAGGVLDGSTVRWNLGTILAGQSGRLQVVAKVGTGLAAGTLLPVDAALLSGTSAVTGAEAARATMTSRVQPNNVLALAIASSSAPARPGEGVRLTFTASNRSNEPINGAVLNARMPTEGFNSLSPSLLSGGGQCAGNCDPYEFVTWNIGTLAPGASRSYSLPATVSGSQTSGRLIQIESELLADGLTPAIARSAVAVDTDNALTLAVHADKDSVAPGEQVTYTLDYANRSTGTINGTMLTFPVPAGAILLGSSGGTMSASSVSWNLAGVLPGAGGRKTVTIAVPAAAGPGALLRVDAATVAGSSAVTGAEAARAALHTRVVAGNPLRLALTGLSPNPLLPGQTLTATLRVTNTGGSALNTIALRARVPSEGVNSFSPSLLSSGGTCSGNCDPDEFASWAFPILAAGASVTVTMPMVISGSAANGRQVLLQALVDDDNTDQSLASGTAMVGTQFAAPGASTPFDADGDGVSDAIDNCLAVANPDQRDTDNDGYGNACDADFDSNGAVSFSDLALFKANFGSTNALYDLDGNGSVSFNDLAIFKSLFGKPPGPSAPPLPGLSRKGTARR